MTSIKLLYVSAPGCHPKGHRNVNITPAYGDKRV